MTREERYQDKKVPESLDELYNDYLKEEHNKIDETNKKEEIYKVENLKKEKTKKINKKPNKKKIYTNIIIFTFILLIIFSSYKLINLYFDSKKIEKTEKKIENIVKEKEVEDTESTIVIENTEPEESLFWKYIKTPLIDVNINELKKLNNDTLGWIKVGGTNINLPFTQTNNNSYYLTHDLEKKYNEFGWVFSDYRNKVDLTDNNLIIYGHNTADTSMFGTLRHVITNNWLNNTDNHIINLSLENKNTLWQVISVYKVNNTTDYIQTDFDKNEYQDFLNLITTRSIYKFDTAVNTNDKILTLSTCSNNDTRIVLHAKLIKYDNKN